MSVAPGGEISMKKRFALISLGAVLLLACGRPGTPERMPDEAGSALQERRFARRYPAREALAGEELAITMTMAVDPSELIRFKGTVSESAAGISEGDPWLAFRFRRASDDQPVLEIAVTDRSAIDIELPEAGEMILDILVGGELPFITGFRFKAEPGSEKFHLLKVE